ncbi:semaphorin-4E [Oryzias melastigma]|uniref:Si:ch211-129c21.1 n=1 Tax=Oryzias melastigma TaxID=30732 RepID=A0A3B3CYU8_ORYME|nr:semaphorin-4E [Oryzias melastigma]XP_024133853.1 semaphorin-4E [Oryzias melastigma]
MSFLPTLSIVCRLIICVCCGALNDHYGVPRNTILHPNDLKVFREDNIYNYTTMLLRDDLGVVLLGAREAIFALDINNISTRKSGVYWPVTEEKQRECTYKGKQAEVECRNYIRTLHIINDTTVYVCGTYAFSPICDYLTFANGQLLLKGKQEEGKGKCPFDPFQRYSSLMVGNDLYSATSINFLGSEPVILRSSGLVALRSDFKKIWLNEPNFVFMDIVGESVDSPDGDDDKVYLFFSENAVEYDFYTKVKVSRVARVCKGDMGGQRTLQRKWTSFLKARLDCSLPEPSLPLIVQDVFLMKHNDWRKGVFYGIFTPQSGLSQVSAVCAYSISDIRNIFNGGKFKTRVAVESSQDKYVMYSGEVPVPRPGACINDVARKMGVNESRQLPDKTLQFVRDRPLMDDAVSPVTGRPLLLKSGPLLTRIVVDSVTALNQQKYHVMFIGTENGFIQKAVNYAGEMFIIEEIQVVDSPEPIGILRLSSSKGHLYAGSDSSVIQMPVSNCRRYKNCVDCVLSRDPYCAWDTSSEQCSSVRSLSTSSKNTVQSLEEGDVSECPAPDPLEAVDFHLVPGNNLQLPCRLHSNLAQAHWQFSDQTLEANNKYYIYSEGLLILNASESDAGLYSCDSVEQISSRTFSRTMALYNVQLPPAPPAPPVVVISTPGTTLAKYSDHTHTQTHTLTTKAKEPMPSPLLPENLTANSKVSHLKVSVALLSLLCLCLLGVIFWFWGRKHLKCLKFVQTLGDREGRKLSAENINGQNRTSETKLLEPESGAVIANNNHSHVDFRVNEDNHLVNITALEGLGYIHDESEI